jgi:hypothetical protein
VTPVKPHEEQEYASSVVASSYDEGVVVSRPHCRQYALKGNRARSSTLAASSGSTSFVRCCASTCSMPSRCETACRICSR